MPTKRPIKKKILPTRLCIEPTFNTTSFNDLTNIHFLQQQNQIKALSKAATQQQEVKKKSF